MSSDVDIAEPRELIGISPTSSERIGTVAAATPADVEAAIGDVAEVQPFWRELPLSARERHLRRLARAALDVGPQVAALIAREQGRPITDAWTGEVIPAVRALRWFSSAGPRELASRRVGGNGRWPLPLASRLAVEPRAVVAAELDLGTPWRTAAERAGAALIAGAGVVLAPSPRCSLVGAAFGELVVRAGLPDGLVRVVHGLTPGDGALGGKGADRLLGPAPLTGGHGGAADSRAARAGAVLLVLGDADLENAVAATSWGAFAHAGQGPFAVRRAFVAEPIAQRFVERLVSQAQALHVGDPRDWRTEVGPMVDHAALAALSGELEAAVAGGATKHCGGPIEVLGLSGAFCAPVVLSDSSAPRQAAGPAVAVSVFGDETAAIAAIRAGAPWSALSVWSEDRVRGARMAADVPTGTVWINAHDPSLDPAALTLALNAGVRRRPVGAGMGRDARWPPYGETVGPAAAAAARFLYGPESERVRTALGERGPLLRAARRMVWGRER